MSKESSPCVSAAELSAATAALVRDDLSAGGVALRDLGLYRLKDFEEAERIFQLVPPTARDGAGPREVFAKLTAGVEEQLAALRHTLQDDLAAFNELVRGLDLPAVAP